MRDLPFFYAPASAGSQTVNLNSGKLWSDYHNLYGYKWDVAVVNNRFGTPRRVSGSSAVQLFIFGENSEEAYKIRRDVYSVFEKDVLKKTPGRLYIGDWYLMCYISGIGSNSANVDRSTIISELQIEAAEWVWRRDGETTIISGKSSSHNSIGYYYSYGYPYCYGYESLGYLIVTNPAIDSSDFEMVIHGPVINPTVTINDFAYGARVGLESGDQLIIDSETRTVKIVRANGDIVNAFGSRLANSFRKLPPGQLKIISNSGATVDLTVMERGSEPAWS